MVNLCCPFFVLIYFPFFVAVYLNVAMILDTKLFFFFPQSTHKVLHYTQNKCLKKTFTKLKMHTMRHAIRGEKLGGGVKRGGRVKGNPGQRTSTYG